MNSKSKRDPVDKNKQILSGDEKHLSLNRRKFLQVSAGLTLVGSLSLEAGGVENRLKITPVTVEINAEQPFKALHISDSHLCLADSRENDRKLKLAQDRKRYFNRGEQYLDAALDHAGKNGELLLYTGDLIDFVSQSNLEAISKKFQNANVFGSAGNHEFSQYVGEAREDAAYKAQSFDRVQKAYPNDLTFASQIVNGVNLVAFDNVYYNVTAEQLARFKEETAKGLPIVAFCHCPFYTPELFDFAMNRPGAKCAYVVAVPEEEMKHYESYRGRQQKADRQTVEFFDWFKKQPLIKALFCGHLHYNWNGPVSPTARQYVVGGNFAGNAYEITFQRKQTDPL